MCSWLEGVSVCGTVGHTFKAHKCGNIVEIVICNDATNLPVRV